MRRMIVLLTLAGVLAAMLVVVGPATAQTSDGSSLTLPTFLHAQMTGEQEVPGPGDPNGIGEAKVKVFRGKVCYRLTAKRIAPATAAHIHKGRKGEAGPVVVPLKPPTDGSSRGCVDISRSLSKKLREHPGRYYVNVHNRPYPAGAIRGQLERD